MHTKYYLRSCMVMLSVPSVCLYVCNTAITFESLDLQSSFLVWRYVFRGYGSGSYMKVNRSSSQGQGHRSRKAWNVIPPLPGLRESTTATAVTASPFHSSNHNLLRYLLRLGDELITFSRSLGQRSRSYSDYGRNFANSTDRELLKDSHQHLRKHLLHFARLGRHSCYVFKVITSKVKVT